MPLTAKTRSTKRQSTPDARPSDLTSFFPSSAELSRSLSSLDYPIVEALLVKKEKFEYLGQCPVTDNKKYFTRSMVANSNLLFGNLMDFYRELAA